MSAKQEWGSKAPPEEEDASKLHLGSDFEAAKGMMLAEVKLVMESKLAQDAQKGEETSTTRTNVFEKTYSYVKRMSYQNATVETTQSIREALASRGLHEFEVSVLGNLALSSAEEAKALVPSLDPEHNPERKAVLSDEEIDAMLNDVATYRNA